MRAGRKARGAVKRAFAVAIGLMASAPALAQSLDSELIPFAVHVDRSPKQPWPGYGVYLWNGYVLTAAHVVGRASETRPRVAVDGRDLPTDVVKEGAFETNDLTLLRVDPRLLPGRLQLRRLSLCTASSAPGEPVIVATPEGTAPSRVMAPQQLPPDIRARFPTAIADVETTGNSGSGVFDASKGCLLGIVSRRIDVVVQPSRLSTPRKVGLAKYFVPVAVIGPFLAEIFQP